MNYSGNNQVFEDFKEMNTKPTLVGLSVPGDLKKVKLNNAVC